MKKVLSLTSLALLIFAAVGLTACNPDKVAQQIVPTVLAKTDSFTYETFTTKRFTALKGSEVFAVFVHSRSCGTCAKKNKEIISDVASFAGGVILKLEYDEASTEFLEEYGVTKYDTFITFDAAGNATTHKGGSVEAVRDAIGGIKISAVEKVIEAIVPTVYAQTDTFTYQDFDQTTYDSLRGNEAFSIFFHSRTCATCAKKNAQIMNEKADFTAGTIFKLEYDQAPTELLTEFGVLKYDTFVNFAADGTFTTAIGGSVDDVRTAIQ